MTAFNFKARPAFVSLATFAQRAKNDLGASHIPAAPKWCGFISWQTAGHFAHNLDPTFTFVSFTRFAKVIGQLRSKF